MLGFCALLGTSDGLKPDAGLLAGYYAAGGEHDPENDRPQPQPMVEDAAPRWAGDAAIGFVSDHPREGYPAWLDGPDSLSIVNADGSGLRCLATAADRNFAVSPDGQRVAMSAGREGVRIIPLAGGEEQVIAAPESVGYGKVAWVDDGRLVVYMQTSSEGRLGLVDLAARSRPAIITAYDRDYFVSADGSVRLTVDTSLAAYAQTLSGRPNLRRPEPLVAPLVLELKAPAHLASRLADMSRGMPIRPTACSKFANSLAALGFGL